MPSGVLQLGTARDEKQRKSVTRCKVVNELSARRTGQGLAAASDPSNHAVACAGELVAGACSAAVRPEEHSLVQQIFRRRPPLIRYLREHDAPLSPQPPATQAPSATGKSKCTSSVDCGFNWAAGVLLVGFVSSRRSSARAKALSCSSGEMRSMRRTCSPLRVPRTTFYHMSD